ncbi:MAG: hypothetical protein A3G20_04435 [Acidobacteria bacterium RIFCSPLOWO2_12_FULL_59_11]|nr:MAG: hypothetical protein A3G20_04435 [Acidobacteria bacterium RIFCSPLOWO2_12_FULL_59_11]
MARRRPRSAKTYRRKGAIREPYDVVLIVCEGEKTEPGYFDGLKRAHRLSSANIKIVSGEGSDPVSIVKHARRELEQDGYDRAFCVFDRDGHVNYQEALDLVANSAPGRKGRLAAITSVPCFEIWVLLHFVYSAAPFSASGGRSACDNVVRAIRGHMPGYQKALANLYEQLQPRVDNAVTNGNRLAQHNLDTRSENPATKVHELVKYLRELKKP